MITRPDVISDIHRMYLEAGADIIETNSFGSTAIVLAEYGLADKAYEISRKSAELARAVADEISTSAKPRFVAGSMGPTTKALTVTGGAYLRRVARKFLRAGTRIAGRRLGHFIAGDLSGHAQHQGWRAGDRTACAGTRPQNSNHGFGDD